MSSSTQTRSSLLPATLPIVEPNVSLAVLVAQMEEHSGLKLTTNRAPLLSTRLAKTLRGRANVRPRASIDIEDQLYTYDDHCLQVAKRQKMMPNTPAVSLLPRR